jgi:hypothetical protein
MDLPLKDELTILDDPDQVQAGTSPPKHVAASVLLGDHLPDDRIQLHGGKIAKLWHLSQGSSK